MGRKIPGRKHHGVRDPEKQHMQRELLLKDKINAPPTNPDDQQIPNSLRRIMDLKDKVKSGAISLKRKRKHKNKNKPVTSHPFGVKPPKDGEKPTPVFTQEKGEADHSFMNRVRKICNSVIKEAEFENKYKVNVKRNGLTGEVEGLVKQDKDELEVYVKQLKKEEKQKGKKKKKKDSDEPKLTKSQKRALKLKEKKEKHKILNEDRFEHLKDKVEFGETVHEPPTLPAPRRVTKLETARPGKKDLLLKPLLDGPKAIETPTITPHKKTEHKVIDKKGKRKDLPNALRRQLDKQQQEVIQAYKLLKAKKYNTSL